MKKLISLTILIGLIALYFATGTETTHTVNYTAFKGGKLGSLNIEINGNIEKVTGGNINKLYWSEDYGIDTITIKQNKYLFHTHYSVVDVQNVDTETYSYTISKINDNEYIGAATDGAGVIFTADLLQPHQHITIGDAVEVAFPVDDYETILSIKEVN